MQAQLLLSTTLLLLILLMLLPRIDNHWSRLQRQSLLSGAVLLLIFDDRLDYMFVLLVSQHSASFLYATVNFISVISGSYRSSLGFGGRS